MTLIGGREHIALAVGNYQIGKLKGRKPTSAQLCKHHAIAIEDLTGIRDRTNKKPRNKTERRHSNSWAFHQLRIFLEYKGIQSGVEVIAVPAAYTSQTCHSCLHIGLRSEKTFKCSNCSLHSDAALNAANVISLLGGSVSGLGRAVLACSLGRLKASAKAHCL